MNNRCKWLELRRQSHVELQETSSNGNCKFTSQWGKALAEVNRLKVAAGLTPLEKATFAKETATWDALSSLALFEHNWLHPHVSLRVPLAKAVAAVGRRLSPPDATAHVHRTADLILEICSATPVRNKPFDYRDRTRALLPLCGGLDGALPDKLAAYINEGISDQPALAKRLLFDRNARWAAWIKARMAKPGTVFIAVGAGHLAGKQSVQDYLKALKIQAKRVAY